MFGEPSRVFVTSGGRDVNHNALTLNKTKTMCKCLFLCFCMLIEGYDLKLLVPLSALLIYFFVKFQFFQIIFIKVKGLMKSMSCWGVVLLLIQGDAKLPKQ